MQNVARADHIGEWRPVITSSGARRLSTIRLADSIEQVARAVATDSGGMSVRPINAEHARYFCMIMILHMYFNIDRHCHVHSCRSLSRRVIAAVLATLMLCYDTRPLVTAHRSSVLDM